MNKLKLILNYQLPRYLPIRFLSYKYEYHMPETYQNAFYLVNATLEDNTNWFVHNAIGFIYTELIEALNREGYNLSKAKNQIASIINLLEPCNNFIELNFPLKRNDGKYEMFRGFRAEHGVYITKKPCLGGLRLCTDIIKSDVRALASLTTYKHACVGINMLGAHGGILVSPKEITQVELHKLIATYAAELTKKGFCDEAVDVFEPDIKCGNKEMMWIAAANSKIRACFGNGCVVGKPIQFGGIKNREKAVAQGIIFGLDTFIQNRKIMKSIGLETGWQNKTFILQGLGCVGSCIGQYLSSMGVKCVGILESNCHIYDADGIDIKEALFYKSKHGSLEDFKSRTKCNEPNAVLIEECDMLVLAAIQNSVPYFIADKVKAKIIVEAANGPIIPSVHKIFVGHSKLVLPDIFINSGSSLASYFEYLKNLQHLPVKTPESFETEYLEMLKLSEDPSLDKQLGLIYRDKNSLRERIMVDRSEKCVVTRVVDRVMENTAKVVIATAEKYRLGLDFRTAAYICAVKKLFWAAYANLKSSPS